MDHMAQPFVFEKLAKQMTHVGKAAPTIERYVAVYAEKTANILPQSRIQREVVELVQTVRFKNKGKTRSAANKEEKWASRGVDSVVFGKQTGTDSQGHFCYCHNENGSDFCN